MTRNNFNLFEKVVPFLILGVAVVVMIALAVLALYLLVWGLVIGVVIYIGFMVKNYFFPTKKPRVDKPGRTIEHDDL